ncbi:MAG: hypothetical protein ACE5H1_08200, partial [Thermodesulfobacteriota bacterium]
MLRLMLLNAALIIICFSISEIALSQTTEGGPDVNPPTAQPPSSGSQEPVINQQDSEAPWYYYWPQENLNPFGMSTLGENSETMETEAGSTLGKSNKRPSNLEVNPPRRERQTNDVIPPDEEQLIAPPVNAPPDETIGNQFTSEINSNLSPSEGSGKIYQWFDKNGVLH